MLTYMYYTCIGHKDYLFHRLLAQTLPYTSFRFDFRGNGESEGSPGYCNILEDADDIHTVAKYFENLGYEIYAVIGHSRGALSSFKYATTCEKPLPIMVNISGRFKMNDNQLNTSRPEIGKALREHGYFDWHVKQRDRIATVKVTQEEVDKFHNYSNDFVSRMPLSTCVLTVHGLKDNIVPPYNAAMFANKISNHTLVLIPDADHNFKGKFEQVTKAIVDFFAKHESSDYLKAIAMGQGTGLVLPRWIDVEGVRNFRDIGGWPLKDGSGYIRERTIFRSGHLSKIAPEGIARLKVLNVKAIFDFRLDHEVKRDGALQEIPGITRFGYNLYENVVKSTADYYKALMVFLNGEKGFAEGYMFILEHGSKLIGDVFRYMIKELSIYDRSAMVIHCAAGKDRTGVFVMVLLGLCGVDDEIIAREYELSNIGYFDYEKDLEKRAKQLNVSVETMRAALSASYGGMKLTISHLKQKYGSFENYVREGCGLNSDEINYIRNLMIVPIRFEERQLYRHKI
ncbi:protein-tyrosine phosphatase-like protein [Cokeromyces recurvatus]|uniref:protein-tyrosine phosphatase-like protein n=1 Tax=Cokeromyces recurvatus TaxID=90255 RepID=UPI0022200787|nr:protein-tyrosine phosphatase-like protein [Cokeromyces recurvatus]KAI7899279.1 protein-tyrosine phosphatase-like protein [Cokeromyces recurvatus]